MKLYSVSYREWDMFFSNLIDCRKLFVGENKDEAIERVKQVVAKDARDFKACEIKAVFGHKITVE